MGRIAGSSPGYIFQVCRESDGDLIPTEFGFQLPSATTIIKEVLAKPPSAMAWWGFKVAAQAASESQLDLRGLDPEDIYDLWKGGDTTPNTTLDAAGDRGSNAHGILELLVKSFHTGDKKVKMRAVKAAETEKKEQGTEYGMAVLSFWEEAIAPHLASGAIRQIISEHVVWSLRHRYSGTFDLALLWDDLSHEPGWEILDAKTHKPNSGFTQPGRGPGYDSDAYQIRAYRTGWEEMGKGSTIGQRTIVLRDKAYRGVRWLEDSREVSEEAWLHLRALYEPRMEF